MLLCTCNANMEYEVGILQAEIKRLEAEVAFFKSQCAFWSAKMQEKE